MSVGLAVATLPCVNGLIADAVQNSIHFEGPTPLTVVHAGVAATAFSNFYNGLPVGSISDLAEYIAPSVSRQLLACRITVYGAPEPPLGTPLLTLNFTLDPTTGDPMPSEVSLVTSYHGNLQGDASDRRRRGRMFIGPLNTNTAIADANQFLRPTAVFMSDLERSTRELGDELLNNGVVALSHVVYSPTYNTQSAVTGGWIDDAFDTQRRRGPDPTVRNIWP